MAKKRPSLLKGGMNSDQEQVNSVGNGRGWAFALRDTLIALCIFCIIVLQRSYQTGQPV